MKYLENNTLDLLVQFIKTNFKMRYQNSILGILWVLIKPYSTFLVLYFVWSSLGLQKIDNYPVYLLLGIVLYTYFNEMIVFGQNALMDKVGIILKVNFPRQVAVISSLSNAVINLLINFVFVIIIALVRGVELGISSIVVFLLVALIFFVFSLGVSFFTSIMTVRLRDLLNIFELGLFLLYWATPIIYVVDPNQPELSSTASLILANPVGILINQVRAGMGIVGEVNWGLLLAYLTVSTIICVLGWFYFNRQVRKVAEYF